jgi:HD-like signal output (HDOD) protein/CheY-like chemotaxis protein
MATPDTELAAASPRRAILFIALDPDTSNAISASLQSKARRWRLHFVAGRSEALEMLAGSPFDAVIADLQAPGIEPSALFREVMEISPEALRIGLTAPDERRTIRDIGAPVHQFLAKPLDPKILTAVLARAFAAQDFLGQEHFERLVGSIHWLPGVPKIHTEIIEAMKSAETSLERIGALVAEDVALSAKVLQLVNSPFFALGRTIAHPSEAAMFLGTETLKALVLSLQVFSQFDQIHSKDFAVENLWTHSWNTGVLARRLCQFEEMDRGTTDEAFIAGLLHDVGKLVLAANFPVEFEKDLRAATEKKAPLWEQEFLTHGASHAELGGFLLRKWGMAPGIVDAVAFHHRPSLARQRSFGPVTAVHLANTIPKPDITHLGLVSSEVDLEYLRSLGIEDRLDDWKEFLLGEVERAV